MMRRSDYKLILGSVIDVDVDVHYQTNNLPHNGMRTKWVSSSVLGKYLTKVQSEFSRCKNASGWNPKILKLRGNLHVIDTCGSGCGDEVGYVRLALIQDHPFLYWLNQKQYMPKAVKALYRKEVRLKHTRATDYWSISEDWNKADKAIHVWMRDASQ